MQALRFTQGTAKRQAILKKLRQLQAFIDQRTRPSTQNRSTRAPIGVLQARVDQIARALRK